MKSKVLILKDAQSPYKMSDANKPEMVRTQIYLTPIEHSFVRSEGLRLGKPMAALIRDWIEEKMQLPEDAWKNSPLLDPPADPDFDMPEDAGINHDHYVYGGPKKYKKV